MYFRECLLQMPILLINLLDVNGQLSSWTQDSLFHILLLDLAISIVVHDIACDSLDNDVDIFVSLFMVNSKNLLIDRLDSGSLLELEIKSGNFQAEIFRSLGAIIHFVSRELVE